ncbi:MAG: hypothetical protein CFE29_27145 [Bradyrhizobiaceae bacterium PARB1]|jgi:hypothetical protein|nr:MAG: hypothetical protein CFE29_27145 [Bradyrhizobiaceae bacterium PARB1]
MDRLSIDADTNSNVCKIGSLGLLRSEARAEEHRRRLAQSEHCWAPEADMKAVGSSPTAIEN